MLSIILYCLICLMYIKTKFTPFSTYSQNSIARTSFGPWKFILDIGSSSHGGFIIAQGQEANGDNLGMYFPSCINNGTCMSVKRTGLNRLDEAQLFFIFTTPIFHGSISCY